MITVSTLSNSINSVRPLLSFFLCCFGMAITRRKSEKLQKNDVLNMFHIQNINRNLDDKIKQEFIQVHLNKLSKCLHFGGVALAVGVSSREIKFFRVWTKTTQQIPMYGQLEYQSYVTDKTQYGLTFYQLVTWQ